MSDPRNRRSALVAVHTAVRRGWLTDDDDGRDELCAGLANLLMSGRATMAEKIRIMRILVEMTRQNLPPAQRGRPRGRRNARRPAPGDPLTDPPPGPAEGP